MSKNWFLVEEESSAAIPSWKEQTVFHASRAKNNVPASSKRKKDFARIIKARNVRKTKENEGKKEGKKRREKNAREEEKKERKRVRSMQTFREMENPEPRLAIVVGRDDSKLPGDTLYRRCKGITDTEKRSVL